MYGLIPVLFACLATHSPQRASTSPLDGAILRVLPNGVRIIIREQHSLPLVAIDAWIRAGSSQERKGESGSAHFIEHLLFKGTTHRKPGEVDNAIEDLGATLNAGTTRSGTHISTTVSSRHADIALEVTCDVLRNATLDPTEVERERKVILDEIAQSANDPSRVATDALFNLLGNHNYMEPLLGTPESIRSLPRTALKAFYDREYRPDNVVFAVVGDITPETAETLVRKHLGDWKSPDRVESVSEEPSNASTVKSAEASKVGPNVVAVGVFLETMTPTDYPVARVIAALLAEGGSGRAANAVGDIAKVDKRAKGVLVESEISRVKNGGLLMLYSVCDSEAAAVTMTALRATLERLKYEPPSDGELDYARRRAEGSLLFDWETFGGQARTLAEFDVWSEFADGIKFGESVAKVSRRQIKDFATRYLNPEKIGAIRRTVGR